MLLIRKAKWFPVFRPFYEGDEGGDGGAGGNAGAAGSSGDANKGEKKFSQADVDRIINERFKAERTKSEKTLAQLRDLQEKGLTPEARESLESQIKNLEESLMTKEQLAAKGLKDTEAKYQKQIGTLEQDVGTWKGRYERSTIERAIMDASSAEGAMEPSQFVMMFGPSARLVQQVGSDGKPTDEFLPMMKFTGVDPETKKPVQMDLPVAEAIAHMRENKLHSNLFKHNATPGTGKAGAGVGDPDASDREPQPEDFKTPAQYQTAYNKWRDTHDIDGKRLKKA